MVRHAKKDNYYANFMHHAWRLSEGMPDIPFLGGGSVTIKEKQLSGGKVLDNYRGGTRSEYLAKYGLSRFSFVYQIPRQEDFGIVDLLCVLGNIKSRKSTDKKKTKLVFPENAFYIQVKANNDDIDLSADSIDWIVNHMSLPLSICVANKEDDSLSFYSISNIWQLLFRQTDITGITLALNKKHDNPVRELMDGDERNHKEIQYIVHLETPFLVKKLSDLEADKDGIETTRAMKEWLEIEEQNIVNKKLGSLFSVQMPEWARTMTERRVLQYYHGTDYRKSEKAISEQLTALAISYASLSRANEWPESEKVELRKKYAILYKFLEIANPKQLETIKLFIQTMHIHPLVPSE